MDEPILTHNSLHNTCVAARTTHTHTLGLLIITFSTSARHPHSAHTHTRTTESNSLRIISIYFRIIMFAKQQQQHRQPPDYLFYINFPIIAAVSFQQTILVSWLRVCTARRAHSKSTRKKVNNQSWP